MSVLSMLCVTTLKDLMFAAVLEGIRVMVETAQVNILPYAFYRRCEIVKVICRSFTKVA